MGLILETERLQLRELTVGDASFMHRLMNDPAWIRNIGDRGVPTVSRTTTYLEQHYIPSYAQHGFGMLLVEERKDQVPAGVTGLVQREGLPGPDLGFGFVPGARSRGFATEASRAIMDWAAAALGVNLLYAVTLPDNEPSVALLQRLGFTLADPGTMAVPGRTLLYQVRLG